MFVIVQRQYDPLMLLIAYRAAELVWYSHYVTITHSTMYKQQNIFIAPSHYFTTTPSTMYKQQNVLYCSIPLRHNNTTHWIWRTECNILLHPTKSKQHNPLCVNSTIYCIAPPHYVTTTPSTMYKQHNVLYFSIPLGHNNTFHYV